jgi:hypothetical protein
MPSWTSIARGMPIFGTPRVGDSRDWLRRTSYLLGGQLFTMLLDVVTSPVFIRYVSQPHYLRLV